jgi:hypothetical protein
VSVDANHPISRPLGAQFPVRTILSLLLCASSGLTQNRSHASPKYDLQTEGKTKGIADEVKLFDLGTRKNFVELMVKRG